MAPKVTNFFGMNVLHTLKNLTHIVLDMVHWDQAILLFRSLDDLFEIVLTELKDKVLYHFPLFIFRIVDV